MTQGQAQRIRGLASEYLSVAPELHICQLIDEINNGKPVATDILVEKIGDQVFGTDMESVYVKVESYIEIRGLIDYEVMQWCVRRVRQLIAR